MINLRPRPKTTSIETGMSDKWKDAVQLRYTTAMILVNDQHALTRGAHALAKHHKAPPESIRRQDSSASSLEALAFGPGTGAATPSSGQAHHKGRSIIELLLVDMEPLQKEGLTGPA